MKLLVLIVVIVLLKFDLLVAQTAVAPISEETCNAFKSIEESTQTSFIAQCTVEVDGCGVLKCVNPTAGSSVLTFQPCTNPPSILSEFYNSTDDLVEEQLLNEYHTVQFGDNALVFNVTQLPDGIGLTVDAEAGGVTIPFIRYTIIPVDVTLCDNATTDSTTPNPTTPDSAGSNHIVMIGLIIFLTICSVWMLLPSQ